MPQTDAPVTGAHGDTRLRWWTEVPVVLLVYGAYAMARILAQGDAARATDHGMSILRAERLLHLNLEHPLNHLFTRYIWIGLPADFWYASLHYIATPGILIWLFRRRPAQFRAARTWLLTATCIALVGFALVPTCPPRLLSAGQGFVDTMSQYSHYGWWGEDASAPRGMGAMTNQFAAMPSLHVGWALWCGLVLWRHSRTPLAKVAAVAYPLITTVVVMGTANHYLFDALAGAATMGLGLLLTRPVLRIADDARLWLGRFAPARKAGAGGPLGAGSRGPARPAPGRPARGASRGGEPARAPAAQAPSPTPGTAPSTVVSAGCQTAAGERIPRQRKQRFEPSPRAAGSGDGAAAAAR